MTLYTLHEDPGHAWVAVPMAELAELGILHRISEYSYQEGGIAYLEDDCDLELWWEAHRARFRKTPEVIRHYQDPSPIRAMPRFKGII